MDDFLNASFLENYEDDEAGWNEEGAGADLPMDEDDEDEDESMGMEDLGDYSE